MELTTAEQIIDYVAAKLVEQNEQSVNSIGTMCMYHGSDGMKCAVGWLIKDEFYSENLEGCSVDHQSVKDALEKSLNRTITDPEIQLLISLQYVHDNIPEDEWAEEIAFVKTEWQEGKYAQLENPQ